jgi:hypothetical protein
MGHRIRCVCIAAPLVSLTSTLAPRARADETRPVVPIHEGEPARRDPLLVTTGAVLFGLPYSASVVAAATSENASDRWLYVPVVGPFGDLVARATCQAPDCRGTNLGTSPLPLAISGLMQAAGAYVFFRALAAPAHASEPSAATIHIVPAATPHGGSLAAFGTF